MDLENSGPGKTVSFPRVNGPDVNSKEGSPYECGIFELNLSFPHEYPFKIFTMRCPAMYHPANINGTFAYHWPDWTPNITVTTLSSNFGNVVLILSQVKSFLATFFESLKQEVAMVDCLNPSILEAITDPETKTLNWSLFAKLAREHTRKHSLPRHRCKSARSSVTPDQ